MKGFIFGFLVLVLSSCAHKKNADKIVVEIADSYYSHLRNGYYPSSIECDSLLNRPVLNVYSAGNLAWKESFEDSIYAELLKVNGKDILSQSNLFTYLVLKEELEQIIDLRICMKHLWNVNPKDGIHIQLLNAIEEERFEDDAQKQMALDRWRKAPELIEREISNLKMGISRGYSMPKGVVRIVISQLNKMLREEEIYSVFISPALGTNDQDFIKDWKALIDKNVVSSLMTYRSYLIADYMVHARDNGSVLSLPNGIECYNALIRRNTSLDISGHEIFEKGQAQVLINKYKVSVLGKDLYGTDIYENIIALNREAGKNFFSSETDVLRYVDSLITQAKRQCRFWFEHIPNAKVFIEAYRGFEYGAGELVPESYSGTSYFKINTSYQVKETKADCQILTFHETYPGHHLQMYYAERNDNIHPIVKALDFAVFEEGWARYAEELAEEMGLYSDLKSNIERRSWSGRAMVIDTGVHLFGWTKQDVIDYVLEAGLDPKVGAGLYYRSLFWPAQLTSYGIGGMEFIALRNRAEEQLKEAFDVRQFHTKLLENGSVPLSVLRYSIQNWIDSKQ